MQEREGLLTGSKLLGSSSDPQPAGFGLSGTTKAGPGEDEGSKGGSSTLGRLLRAGGAGLAAAKGSLYELSGGQAEGVRRSVAGGLVGSVLFQVTNVQLHLWQATVHACRYRLVHQAVEINVTSDSCHDTALHIVGCMQWRTSLTLEMRQTITASCLHALHRTGSTPTSVIKAPASQL